MCHNHLKTKSNIINKNNNYLLNNEVLQESENQMIYKNALNEIKAITTQLTEPNLFASEDDLDELEFQLNQLIQQNSSKIPIYINTEKLFKQYMY